ncbi:MAG: hypothetical protein BRD57_01475, partial [Proteobacteria bacterium SW_6_67_9]
MFRWYTDDFGGSVDDALAYERPGDQTRTGEHLGDRDDGDHRERHILRRRVGHHTRTEDLVEPVTQNDGCRA